MSENPLVSIFVLTYNSSQYVLETLESIKRQTYSNIELCVSDDCSQDDTILKCQQWIEYNKDRFVRAEILTTPINTGISANFNRGYRWCKSSWVKCIAGDDQLMPNCINSNITYVQNHKNVDVVFSSQQLFNESGNLSIANYNKYFTRLSLKEFRILLLYSNFLPAATAFIKKEVLDEIGGADESIPFMEDKPLWVKLSFLGHNLCYNDTVTVRYRISSSSISQGKDTRLKNKFQETLKVANKKFLKNMEDISFLYGKYGRIRYQYKYENNLVNSIKYYLKFLNPYFWYIKIIKYRVRI